MTKPKLRLSLKNRRKCLTGNPSFLDVVAISPGALIRYVDFVAEVTDAPFLVDGSTAAVRIPAMKHAIETGLKDRAIYNSIDFTIKPQEIRTLKELGIASSVVMAFNTRNPWPDGRIEILHGFQTIS